jgi:MipA family protein
VAASLAPLALMGLTGLMDLMGLMGLMAKVAPVALLALLCGLPAARAGGEVTSEARRWEGAVGFAATWAPEYAGAGTSRLRLVPAGFLRCGRFSISGAGGFGTRRNDDVERGLAASLIERSQWRVGFALRVDSGRRESGSDRLRGMGDIDSTLRARLSVHWRPQRHWSITTGLSADALSQGNGWWAQIGVNRQFPFTPDTALGVGVSARWAGEDYARQWFGVTPAQSARTGYPVYRPGSGWSDLQLSTRLRTEFSPRWSGFVGAGVSWQLGPSRDSPLRQDAFGWSLGSGVVWRI